MINAMAMAVVAATAFSPSPSARAAVIRGEPAQVRPEIAPATLNSIAELGIDGFNQNFNGGILETSIATGNVITCDVFDAMISTAPPLSDSMLTLMQIDSQLSADSNPIATNQTDVRTDKLTGETAFPGSIWIRSGAIYAPGGPPRGTNKGTSPAHITGNYTQDNGAALLMNISKNRSDLLIVGGNVSLDGVLALTLTGALDGGYRVLIENRGATPIHGAFSGICFDNQWVTLNPLEDTRGGGTFAVNGVVYTISYAGNAAAGSLYGGNDLVLCAFNKGCVPEAAPVSDSSFAGYVGVSFGGGRPGGGARGGSPGTNTPGGGGGNPPSVPEPASLAVLGLGTVMLIARRRK